jgi:hypothetical protein
MICSVYATKNGARGMATKNTKSTKTERRKQADGPRSTDAASLFVLFVFFVAIPLADGPRRENLPE